MSRKKVKGPITYRRILRVLVETRIDGWSWDEGAQKWCLAHSLIRRVGDASDLDRSLGVNGTFELTRNGVTLTNHLEGYLLQLLRGMRDTGQLTHGSAEHGRTKEHDNTKQ